jgi:hypothetical protein
MSFYADLTGAHATRESWLIAGAAELAERIITPTSGSPSPRPFCVSVGFPKLRGRGARGLSQTWTPSESDDTRHHVFISPVVSDAPTALLQLLHELVHCSAEMPADVGAEPHNAEFVALAAACGLVAPWTSAKASPDLLTRLAVIARELGPYPHGALHPKRVASGTTRLRLWECGCSKPVKVRVASDDFQAHCDRCKKPFVRA